MLRKAVRRGPVRGIMHSFTASEATAVECLELGLHISFAGMVTYKKSDELRRITRLVPDDRILIETDSPFLAPLPHRGKTGEPAFVADALTFLANLRDDDTEALGSATSANCYALFNKAMP